MFEKSLIGIVDYIVKWFHKDPESDFRLYAGMDALFGVVAIWYVFCRNDN